jgi:hypothetical protein
MAGVIQKKVISGRTVKAAAAAAISKAVVDFARKKISGAITNDNSRRQMTAENAFHSPDAKSLTALRESGGSTT